MTSPTFVLGLGAQKAGTTWLHRYLGGAGEFAAGPMKEYHVWNAIYRIDGADVPTLEGSDTAAREALRQRMIAAPDAYFDHFAELLEQNGKTIAADITPAYSALPPEALERICSGFQARGIAVKAVFLIRDPVERCWSAARMYRRKQLSVAGLSPALGEAEFVRAYAASAHSQNRGRYEATIRHVERAFASGDCFFGIYEELFERASVNALSAFLGVRPRPEAAGTAHNVSPKHSELPLDVQREVATAYAETLAVCAERFPRTCALWRSYDLVKAA